jgi:hypothetical protein
VNAGRNTHKHVPLPPATDQHDDLADEAQDSERRFLDHVHAHGIRLADYEAKT